jgi:glycosyltransferase involved in cell wall biosynthesis
VEVRRVVYVQYANPAAYPPLQHSASILASAGWQVDLLGITQPRVAGLEFSVHSRISVRLLPPSTAGWRQKVHYLRFCLWTLSEIRRRGPVWVYASDTLSAPVAFVASFIPSVRLLYHEHDAPDEQNRSQFMRLLLSLRRRVLERARIVVVPNAERGRALCEAGTDVHRLFCVWNCPEHDEASTTPRPEAGDGFSIIYHGSIVPARLPESVVRALATLPNVRLRIRGYETAGHENYVDRLRDIARSLGIESRLDIKLLVPTRTALFEDVRASDLGLALMPSESVDINERNMSGASNKAFEYLAQGVPLLVSDLPDWCEMFVRGGVARACRPEDPSSVATAITWFAEHKTEARVMGESGRQMILAKWNYEQQFEPVLRRMSAA